MSKSSNQWIRNKALPIFLSALVSAGAMDFEDRWLTRIKPPPYSGVATRFDDRRGAWGNKINPDHDYVCAHLLERFGQKLKITNVANGKSAVCRVADKGPNRKFWPRREVDMTPPVDNAIGCHGLCKVEIERVAE